jgi:hypothetical protein
VYGQPEGAGAGAATGAPPVGPETLAKQDLFLKEQPAGHWDAYLTLLGQTTGDGAGGGPGTTLGCTTGAGAVTTG